MCKTFLLLSHSSEILSLNRLLGFDSTQQYSLFHKPYFSHGHNLREARKQKLLGRCSAAGSWAESSRFCPIPAGWAPRSAPVQRSPAGRAVTAMVTGLPILSAAPRAVAAPVTRAGKLKRPGRCWEPLGTILSAGQISTWGGAWFEVS